MLWCIEFSKDLPGEYLYCGGILLINDSLPAARILEIIEMFLGGEEVGDN